MLRPLTWLTLLSLDAPLVAVAWQSLLARVHAFDIGWHHRAIVFLSVWLGYAADRWFDSQGSEALATERHRFARSQRQTTAILWLFALATAVSISIATLSLPEFLHGLVLMAIALVYTAFAQKARRLPYYGTIKASLVAVLIAASATLFMPWPHILETASDFALIVLLFFSNCLLIRSWELPASHAARFLPLSLSATAGFAILSTALSESPFLLLPFAASLSVSSLWILHFFRNRFTPSIRRTLADLCLLWPLALLPFA